MEQLSLTTFFTVILPPIGFILGGIIAIWNRISKVSAKADIATEKANNNAVLLMQIKADLENKIKEEKEHAASQLNKLENSFGENRKEVKGEFLELNKKLDRLLEYHINK